MTLLFAEFVENRWNHARTIGWIAVAALALMLGASLLKASGQPTTDFHSYFTSGHLVVEGKPVAQFYDEDWFNSEANRFVPGLHEIYGPNLPTTAVFYTPLAFFQSHVVAHRLWTLLSIPLLILFVEGLARISGTETWVKPYWYAAVLIAQPVKVNLFLGQAYIVIGLVLILALRSWQQRNARGGALLATLFAYKSAGIFLWPLAAATGRWRLVLVGTAALLAIVVVTWPLIGWEGWSAYFAYLRDTAASPRMRSTAYQSLPGFVQHLFGGGGGPGSPLLELDPGFARGIAVALVVTLLGITTVVAHRSDDELTFSAGVLLTLIAVPVTLVHAYTLTFIPLAQLLSRLRLRPLQWRMVLLAIGAAVAILPTPIASRGLLDGWAALLAYPKLYGALLLWTLCISVMAENKRARERVA